MNTQHRWKVVLAVLVALSALGIAVRQGHVSPLGHAELLAIRGGTECEECVADIILPKNWTRV